MVLLKNHIASLKCAILSYLKLRSKLIYWECDQCKRVKRAGWTGQMGQKIDAKFLAISVLTIKFLGA